MSKGTPEGEKIKKVLKQNGITVRAANAEGIHTEDTGYGLFIGYELIDDRSGKKLHSYKGVGYEWIKSYCKERGWL